MKYNNKMKYFLGINTELTNYQTSHAHHLYQLICYFQLGIHTIETSVDRIAMAGSSSLTFSEILQSDSKHCSRDCILC